MTYGGTASERIEAANTVRERQAFSLEGWTGKWHTLPFWLKTACHTNLSLDFCVPPSVISFVPCLARSVDIIWFQTSVALRTSGFSAALRTWPSVSVLHCAPGRSDPKWLLLANWPLTAFAPGSVPRLSTKPTQPCCRHRKRRRRRQGSARPSASRSRRRRLRPP